MSILSQLQGDPTGTLIAILYRIPAVLIALTLHELAHGYVAMRCGDPTAQMLGRLSFNPLKHLDPVGTLCMFLFGYGWARPVPVNSRNFKNFRRDDLLVSIAGVVTNFCLFLFSMILMTGVHYFLWKPELWEMGEAFSLLNARDFLSFEGVNFNFAYAGKGVVALEWAKDGRVYVEDVIIYLQTPWLAYVQRFLMNFSLVNLGLCLFNLLPIPPLDGYHVVNDIFLRGKLHIPARIMNVLMVGLLVICFATNFFSDLVAKAMYFVQGGVLNVLLAVFGMG